MGYADQSAVVPNLLAELNETKEKLAAKEAKLIEMKNKSQAFLSETLRVSNAIQVMKDGLLGDDYQQAWELVREFRHSLRGDSGAGKELKKAIK